VCPKYSSVFENDTLQVMSGDVSATSVGQRGHYVLQQTRYGFSALPKSDTGRRCILHFDLAVVSQ